MISSVLLLLSSALPLSGRLDKHNLGATAGGFAYNPTCFLGSGISFAQLANGAECRSPVLEPVHHCKQLGPNTDFTPCIQLTNSSSISSFTRTVSNVQNSKKLIDVAVSASGAGWGVSASASTQFISTHSSSSDSVSFYIGAGGSLYSKSLQFPQNLKLTAGPEFLLKNGRFDDFLAVHGTHYVYKIDYGGSFMGSIEVQSTMSSESQSIVVDVSAAYDKGGPFSASGSAKFKDTMSKYQKTTHITASAVFNGGTTDFDPSNPSDMADTFSKWWNNVRHPASAKGLVMYFRPYYDISQVAKYVDMTGNVTLGNIFQRAQPSSTIMNYITKEYTLVSIDLNALQNAKQFQCVRKSSTFRAALQALETKMAAHKVNIEKLSQKAIYQLDADMGRGDMSFFKANAGVFSNAFEVLIDGNPACGSCAMTDVDLWSKTNLDSAYVGTYDGCKKICEENSQCVAVTYFYQHGAPQWPQCYLKSTWPKFAVYQNKNVRTSGADTCSCFKWGYATAYGQALAAVMGSLGGGSAFVVSSPQACQDRCAATAACANWTWDSETSGCYMQNASVASTPVVNAKMVSGPVKCPYPLDL